MEAETGHAMQQLWLLDRAVNDHRALARALKPMGIEVTRFACVMELLSHHNSAAPTVILADMDWPEMEAGDLLDRLRAGFPSIPVILMTQCPVLESAVMAFRRGAFEYLPKPYDPDEAMNLIRRACRQPATSIPPPAPTGHLTTAIIGGAPAMHEVFRAIARLARADVTVLIQGEAGTGKEMVARALHRHSPRSEAPFIVVNLSTIPPALMETQWFGQDGAVTLSEENAECLGRFQQADGGTLFLDEVGDMPPLLQTQLLRVLVDGEFFPLGTRVPVRANVRVIAATQHDLTRLVTEGRFREDLYHRLNAVRIPLPPLRERRQDIPLLLRHFIREAARELGTESKILRPETEAYLGGMDWPGNVRQLQNTCRSITALAMGREVYIEDLPAELLQGRQPLTPDMAERWEDVFRYWIRRRLREGEKNIARDVIELAEGILIETALDITHGRREEAARLLGYGRNTVSRKIADLKLPIASR